MTNKFLIQLSVGAFTVFMLALVVVARVSSGTPAIATVEVPHAPQIVHAGMTMETQTPPRPADEPLFVQPLANSVRTADLDNLAARVHLKNASLADVDKNQWKIALVRAQQFLQGGACDCEERNWLNHFVETGNQALSGAKEYQDSAKFLAALPKNDEEGMKHTVSE